MPTVRPATRAALRIAAVCIALGVAHLLTTLGRDVPGQPTYGWRFLRALAVTVPFQAGLFWAASARGWHRLVAGVLMIPTFLLLLGFVGEAASRIYRGYPLNVTATLTFAGGVAVYLWAYATIVRRWRS
jgi:hypothetical protein